MHQLHRIPKILKILPHETLSSQWENQPQSISSTEFLPLKAESEVQLILRDLEPHTLYTQWRIWYQCISSTKFLPPTSESEAQQILRALNPKLYAHSGAFNCNASAPQTPNSPKNPYARSPSLSMIYSTTKNHFHRIFALPQPILESNKSSETLSPKLYALNDAIDCNASAPYKFNNFQKFLYPKTANSQWWIQQQYINS